MDDAFFLRAAKKQEAGFMRVGMKMGALSTLNKVESCYMICMLTL